MTADIGVIGAAPLDGEPRRRAADEAASTGCPPDAIDERFPLVF